MVIENVRTVSVGETL